MLKQATITVTGKVQGVFYRVWVKRQAEEIGLMGFARNDPNGSVEVIVEGEEENIQELIDRAGDGPELADVADVRVSWGEYEGTFDSFSIR